MLSRDASVGSGGAAPRGHPGGAGWRALATLAAWLPAALLTSCSDMPEAVVSFAEFSPGAGLATQKVERIPWSILVLRVDRSKPDLALHSVHAHGTSVGLSTLSEQAMSIDPVRATPLAAINADYYQMWGRAYAGDARGLQVVDGELLGVAAEGICYWSDPAGRPQAGKVLSRFRVTWPGGYTNSFGLNEAVQTNRLVLFTSSLGMSSTGTTNACELVLERAGDGPWLPLAIGKSLTARVREIRPEGNARLTPDVMVLAVDTDLAWKVPGIEPGAILKFDFDVSPDLKGISMAIGGGPLLVHEGKRQSLRQPAGFGVFPYEYRSMFERHPRTALGWNDRYLYLVQVDGRQKTNSVGMTLRELASYMIKLGCREVINFDGGGSSEMWCNGRVVNQPCDLQERDVANSLVLVRKKTVPFTASPAGRSVAQ